VEELCLALRDVGVFNRQLPDGIDVRKAIFRAKTIYAEIEHRSLDLTPRIARLSNETRWDMESLFISTIAFPQAVPYLVSTPDPRCGHCGKQISRKATLALCPNCTRDAMEDISGERTTSHLSVCSICGQSEICFLVIDDEHYMYYCKSCLQEEQSRQHVA
jgi:predicted RNA-binding Zn-ribbon protein involved in translation (DUF1610 family)